MPRQHLGLLLAGLAAGDSLGSTSEFMSREEVLDLYAEHRKEGWPFRHVGGGHFGWRPGEPTDDTQMAACIVSSFIEKGEFVPDDIARRFVKWAKSGPKDIGATTVRGLGSISLGVPWFEGGLETFTFKPQDASNGSLMRNGVIPGMAESLDEAFRYSLYQSIITHYSPLPVICCGVQTYLIWEFLEGRNPLQGDWLKAFWTRWIEWYNDTKTDEAIEKWSNNVAEEYPRAYKALKDADFNCESFNPFEYSPLGSAGYVLTTLQTALWGANWSLKDDDLSVPDGYPKEAFKKKGPYVLGWLAMTGGDTDTYCATAGPIIAAAHGSLPDELIEGLEICERFPDLVPKPQ